MFHLVPFPESPSIRAPILGDLVSVPFRPPARWSSGLPRPQPDCRRRWNPTKHYWAGSRTTVRSTDDCYRRRSEAADYYAQRLLLGPPMPFRWIRKLRCWKLSTGCWGCELLYCCDVEDCWCRSDYCRHLRCWLDVCSSCDCAPDSVADDGAWLNCHQCWPGVHPRDLSSKFRDNDTTMWNDLWTDRRLPNAVAKIRGERADSVEVQTRWRRVLAVSRAQTDAVFWRAP